MKKLILLISATIIASCTSYKESLIKFNPDGSGSINLYVISNDSSVFYSKNNKVFPVKIDKNWITSFNPDSSKTIICTANREFDANEHISSIYKLASSKWKNVAHKITFERKFRWFYTYYEFRETYHKTNPYKLPVRNYLTHKELLLWCNEDSSLIKGKDSVEIKTIQKRIDDKTNKWLVDAVKPEIIAGFKKVLTKFNDPSINTNKIISDTNLINIQIDKFEYNKAIDYLVLKYKNKNFSKLKSPEYEKIFKSCFKLDSLTDMFYEELNCKIIMPGIITETNSLKIKKDTLVWEVKADNFVFKDYTLVAKSQTTNKWAFYITGFIVLMAIAYFILKRKWTKTQLLKTP